MSALEFDPANIHVGAFWSVGSDEMRVSVSYGPQEIDTPEELKKKVAAVFSQDDVTSELTQKVSNELVAHVHSWWSVLSDTEKSAIDDEVNP